MTWESRISKTPIDVPKNVWTTLDRYDDLPEGPTILEAELYGTLPSTKPKDIRTRWLRVADDNPTKRAGHVVGTDAAWSTVTTALEYIDPAEDLPLELQILHNGGSALRITTVITKVLNPAAYIASRIAP